MRKFKRLLSLFLALAMLVLAVAPLAACGDTEETEGCTHVDSNEDGKCDSCGSDLKPADTSTCKKHKDDNGDGKCDNDGCDVVLSNYTVTVVTAGGMKLEGINVDLYNGGKLESYGTTDSMGRVEFAKLPASSTYTVELSNLPEGYSVATEYSFGTTNTLKITLSSTVTEDVGLSGVTYQAGDIIADFTVTDCYGNKVNLKTLLETKKAVVLNFWYTTCSWCIEEFPDMNAAYKDYKDDVEIIALNIYHESKEEIAAFKEAYGLEFPMADDSLDIYSTFPFSGAPCTAIVDRYGMITVTEIGAIIGTSYWRKAFAHYTDDNYQQKVVESIKELAPVETPDIEQESSDVIYDAFVNKDQTIIVDFHPEEKPGDAEYSWPFAVTEKNGIGAIAPTNGAFAGKPGKDNSYATIYADVYLEAGQALLFDYLSYTENSSEGADFLYVIVDGKDIYSIAGLAKDEAWDTCCAYVAKESRTYEVAFCYIKDASEGDASIEDTVYLSNLRIVSENEVDVETYIYRFAATELNDYETDYENYVTVVLGDDGYYHVGTEDGPLLLANLLSYSNFDSDNTVFERFYTDDTFMVDGQDMYYQFEMYGNYASNSSIYYYCTVTEELKILLDAYVAKYATEVGKKYNENTWLQLCAYYDAYGTDGVQLEDPIKGLASFSAYEALETPEGEENVYNTVEYGRVVIPRGYLYKFVPPWAAS